MKWVVVIVTIIVALVIVGALGVAYHLKTNFPKADPPYNIRVSGTPETDRTGALFSQSRHGMSRMPFNAGLGALFCATRCRALRAKAARYFPKQAGFPGTLIAPNITPVALGDWTDGEINSGFYQRRK